MGTDFFIGRKDELKKLRLLLKKNSASLIVVKGRRRIGKSRLIQEFGKELTLFTFSGVFPTEETTHQDQLREFGWQLGKVLGQPAFKDDDWNDLFLRLAQHTNKGRVIILFDEISWMGSKDPNFLGKLKNAWDLEFKNNPQLILVLCGSVSTWIETNILSSSAFFGRISLDLTLEGFLCLSAIIFGGNGKNLFLLMKNSKYFPSWEEFQNIWKKFILPYLQKIILKIFVLKNQVL